VHRVAKVDVDSAIPVAFPASQKGAAADSATAAPAASEAPATSANSGSGGLPMAVLIAIGLILFLAVVRLALFLQHRRTRRQWQEERLKREHEWQAAMRRVKLERAIEASSPQGQTVTLNRGRS
jgi:hypothetical protein